MVGSQFEGQWIASSMLRVLENHTAANKLIQNTGAIRLSDGVHFGRVLRKPALKVKKPGVVALTTNNIIQSEQY